MRGLPTSNVPVFETTPGTVMQTATSLHPQNLHRERPHGSCTKCSSADKRTKHNSNRHTHTHSHTGHTHTHTTQKYELQGGMQINLSELVLGPTGTSRSTFWRSTMQTTSAKPVVKGKNNDPMQSTPGQTKSGCPTSRVNGHGTIPMGFATLSVYVFLLEHSAKRPWG